MNIVKMKFGSHLYGTNTESSDTDIKGIFQVPLNDCILNNIPKSINTKTKVGEGKNTKDDIDQEFYSLQYFMKLATNSEMIVIDMLHAPEDCILETSELWKDLQANRSKFYSKNMAGYLGYVRSQCAKYSCKGSRLASMEKLLSFLIGYDREDKLSTIFDILPIDEYCKFIDTPLESRWRTYECCGKQVQETVTIGYAWDIINRLYNSYGTRAQLAKENQGIDWKSVSHGYRAMLQLKEIYTTGDLVYPLKDRDFLTDLKLGKLHYVEDKIGEGLDSLLAEVEELAKNSNYPSKINIKWANDFILNAYGV